MIDFLKVFGIGVIGVLAACAAMFLVVGGITLLMGVSGILGLKILVLVIFAGPAIYVIGLIIMDIFDIY